MELINYQLINSQIAEILSRFSENPVEALGLWIIECPDEVKDLVDYYHNAVMSANKLQDFLDM